jgi:hypothetical protein
VQRVFLAVKSVLMFSFSTFELHVQGECQIRATSFVCVGGILEDSPNVAVLTLCDSQTTHAPPTCPIARPKYVIMCSIDLLVAIATVLRDSSSTTILDATLIASRDFESD